MRFDELNLEALYQDHLRDANYERWPAQHWDDKARRYAKRVLQDKSDYNEAMLKIINPTPEMTVLDVGCGPGTLALPLAKQVHHVRAMDYSQGMLEVLQEEAHQRGLTNITTYHLAWEDDWQVVPVCDVAIASRSTLVGNLTEMVDKLSAKARQRVICTAPTSGLFLPRELYEAAGLELPVVYPDYSYIVMLLMQRGLTPTLSYIDTPSRGMPEPVDDIIKSVQSRCGNLTPAQLEKLKTYCDEQARLGQGVHRGQDRWAVISWAGCAN